MTTDLIADDTYHIPDDSLAEVAETCPDLNDRERRLVYYIVTGVPTNVAYVQAGYSGTVWKPVVSRPKIRKALADMIEKMTPEHRVTKNSVVDILLEAIEVARRKDQAMNLITGAKTLAEVCGLMPTQKYEVSSQQNIEIQHQVKHEIKMINQLPRAQLEHILDINRTLPSGQPALEGEYTIEASKN